MELAAAAAALTANNNDIINNKHSASSSSKFVDPAIFLQKELTEQVQANFLSSLPAGKNLIGGDQSGSNTLMKKSSLAHKPNSSDKQLRIPLNHGENQMKVHLEELSKIRNLDLSATSITAVPPQQQIGQSNQNSNHAIPEKKKRVRDSGGTRNVYDSIKGFNTRSKTAAGHHHNDLKNHELEPSVTITIQNPTITPAPIRGTKRKSSERHEMARNEKLLKKQQEEKINLMKKIIFQIKENQEKLLELQKQEQLKISAEIEHERVNQHQMFIHALNELKTSEDRDSKKEELSLEKVALQERKLLKRVLEVELLKELKKPVEDMMLKDHKNLPIFNRIPGQKLTGKAFADLLMVYEFLYNFGETIGFDVDSLPTLNSLMKSLLNLDSDAEEELMSIVNHLVICAIEDPGMPNNMTTLMGQKLKDATVTEHNVTEILRLYFLAFSNAVREEDEPNRIECKIHDKLCSGISFIALDAISKLDILVFLCNELLCNQAIVKQIDDSIESVTVYKKDKWGIENDIRKLRLVKMRRERIIEEEKAKQLLLQQEKDNANTNQSLTTAGENGTENATNTGENTTTGAGENSTVISDNDESNTNVSAATLSNSVTTITLPPIEFDDDVNMTIDEIDKKIERLNKQCNQMNNKMHKALNAFRVFPLGQDRYRRTYWVLPNCGGVFVEGMESGEPEELVNNVWTEEEIEMENALKNAIEDESMVDLNAGDGEIKSEFDKQSVNDNNVVEQPDTMSIKEENDDPNATDDDKKPIVNDDEQDKPNIETKMETDDPVKIESNDDEMATNQTDKKEELSESEQIDENNELLSEDINVNDVRWFSLDLDFECDGSVEKVIDEPTAEKEKDEETMEEKDEIIAEQDDQNQDKKEEEETAEEKEKDAIDEEEGEEEEITEIKEESEPMSEMERALTTFMSQETLDCLFKNNETNIECIILKDCLLRILSSFARSASITKFPNSEVIETDIIVCPTLQKRIQLWKVLQYEKPRKVPREYQLGWWRITDGVQLKSMIELLHSNALREKNLQKYLIKHLNYATQSCRNSSANLDVGDYDRDASDWREFGAPTENRCPHRSCLGKGYCQEVAFRKDLQVLELIEAFEEKILSCSMQIRNWKPSNKLSSADFKSKLHQSKSS
ncbi:toutatis-like protein, partial [Euroglyphus maynei]